MPDASASVGELRRGRPRRADRATAGDADRARAPGLALRPAPTGRAGAACAGGPHVDLADRETRPRSAPARSATSVGCPPGRHQARQTTASTVVDARRPRSADRADRRRRSRVHRGEAASPPRSSSADASPSVSRSDCPEADGRAARPRSVHRAATVDAARRTWRHGHRARASRPRRHRLRRRAGRVSTNSARVDPAVGLAITLRRSSRWRRRRPGPRRRAHVSPARRRGRPRSWRFARLVISRTPSPSTAGGGQRRGPAGRTSTPPGSRTRTRPPSAASNGWWTLGQAPRTRPAGRSSGLATTARTVAANVGHRRPT